jgi:hypothetical protein
VIARLLRLLLLKQRAALRQFVRSLRNPRRAIGLLCMVALLSAGAWQSWRSDTGFAKDGLGVICAMIFVMSVANGLVQQGPRFAPADVDFLFPAPFSPRHLLIWRLLHLWPIAFLSTAFLVFMLGARFERPVRFFCGMFLLQATAVHLQLLIAVLMTLAGDALAKKLRGIGRIAAVIALLGALAYLMVTVSQQGGISSALANFTQAKSAKVLLFPVVACVDFVFGETPRQTTFAFLSLALGAVGTFGLLMMPDVDYREDSVATTARIARLLAARRRTGATIDIVEGTRVRSGALPASRVLFRASGAIVWKNLILLARSWKSVAPSVVVGLLLVLPIILATRNASLEPAGFAMIPIVMVTLFWSNTLGFDLRREIDRLDQLRALPLSASSIVLAELLVPWALGVSLQEALVAVISFTGHGDRRGLGMLALTLPLLTFLAVVIDNLGVFLFQAKVTGAARGAVASTSPAQILRLFAWIFAVIPGPLLAWWLLAWLKDPFWPFIAGATVEVALAVGLFFLLVSWYQSRDVEVGE